MYLLDYIKYNYDPYHPEEVGLKDIDQLIPAQCRTLRGIEIRHIVEQYIAGHDEP